MRHRSYNRNFASDSFFELVHFYYFPFPSPVALYHIEIEMSTIDAAHQKDRLCEAVGFVVCFIS